MTKPITRAMIMAAGLGTRMRPLTFDRPKPLVEVRGKTLIDHAVDRLVQAGVKLIVVNVHYHADMLMAHLKKRRDVEIRFSEETDVLLGTGGGIVKALPNFEGEPFFVHNSDSIWVEGIGRALERLQAIWNPEEMDALLLLASMVTALGFEGTGDYNLDSDAIGFAGAIKLRATVSQLVTGWKGILLRPLDRFFERNGAGTYLRIRIEGTSKAPRLGVFIAGHEITAPLPKR